MNGTPTVSQNDMAIDKVLLQFSKIKIKKIYTTLEEIWKSNKSIQDKICLSHDPCVSVLLSELQLQFFSEICVINRPKNGYYVIHQILNDEITKTYNIEQRHLNSFELFYGFLKDIQEFIESKCEYTNNLIIK